jgi:hypothetical protein
LAEELTFDLLKLSSMNKHRFMSYFWISLSVANIFISLTSALAQPPFWYTRILIMPSSLATGISPNGLYYIFVSFAAYCSFPFPLCIAVACPLGSNHEFLAPKV